MPRRLECLQVRFCSKQTAADTFRVWLDRGGNPYRLGQPWEPFAIAYHPGDANYRRADRPVNVTTAVPVLIISGTMQTIALPTIANQVATNQQNVSLNATASSGKPCQYSVLSGPYHATGINGGTLVPDTIPSKEAWPLRVIVVAWQWGQNVSPQIQSATPLRKTFWVHKNALEQWRYEQFGTLTTDPNGEQQWTINTTTSADNADNDSDGVPNLIEFAFGMNPAVSNTSAFTISGTTLTSHGMPAMNLAVGGNGTARFMRRNTYAIDGLTYTPQFSADLVSWQNSTDTPSIVASDATHELVEVPFPLVLSGAQSGFFRITMNQTP